MKVLSIQTGHNATIALCDGGEIIGVLSQEKCDNIKNSSKFPKEAIASLLQEVGWSTKDIEKILICSENVLPPNTFNYFTDSKGRNKDSSLFIRFAKLLRNSVLGKLAPSVFEWLRNKRLNRLIKSGKNYLLNELSSFGFHGIPIEHIEHHLCHASSAYYTFEKENIIGPSIIFTLDGAGDFSCSSVTYINENGDWEKIAETPIHSSLGIIYAETTRFLGMKTMEHEYKVMGLAAYSKQNYTQELYERIFKPIIFLSNEDGLIFKSKINTSNFYDYLVENALGERFDNIAGALQLLTETLVTKWIENGLKKTSAKNVFLGGGVFMNVKLNQKIAAIDNINKLYIMPSCGDESNPIGACYYNASINQETIKPLKNLYLGISFSDEEIKNYILRNKLEEKYAVEEFDKIEKKISELLINREIIARFSKRGEWGGKVIRK